MELTYFIFFFQAEDGIRDTSVTGVQTCALPISFLVGIPLMRLSGLAAGIATFAVLEITQNIVRNWEKIGPGPLTLSTVPETTDLWPATIGAIAVACVAFAYQLSPLGRKLRAAREDPFAAQA